MVQDIMMVEKRNLLFLEPVATGRGTMFVGDGWEVDSGIGMAQETFEFGFITAPTGLTRYDPCWAALHGSEERKSPFVK